MILFMTFTTVDPATKDFLMTSKIRSWEKLVVEALKCVMLCSHCHRKVHVGLVSIPLDAPVFSEALVASSDYARHIVPDMDSCPVCGKQKHIARKTCSRRCAGSMHASGKKPLDMVAILERVKISGYWTVARTLGVTDNTLRKWLANSGLEVPRFRASRTLKWLEPRPPLAQQ